MTIGKRKTKPRQGNEKEGDRQGGGREGKQKVNLKPSPFWEKNSKKKKLKMGGKTEEGQRDQKSSSNKKMMKERFRAFLGSKGCGRRGGERSARGGGGVIRRMLQKCWKKKDPEINYLVYLR